MAGLRGSPRWVQARSGSELTGQPENEGESGDEVNKKGVKQVGKIQEKMLQTIASSLESPEKNKKKVKDYEVVVNVNMDNIDSYLEKATQYVELLKKAKALAEELASVNFEIRITT